MNVNLTLSHLPPEMMREVLKNSSLAEIIALSQTSKRQSQVVQKMFASVAELKEAFVANKKAQARLEKEAWDDKLWGWFFRIPLLLLANGCAAAIFIQPLIMFLLGCPLAWTLGIFLGLFVIFGPLFCVAERLDYAAHERTFARNRSLAQINWLIEEQTKKLKNSSANLLL